MNTTNPQSQPLAETEYKLISLDQGEAILYNTLSKKYEQWYSSPHYAGYTIIIHGQQYEFVKEL